MPIVLVVDDSEVDRRLVGGLVHKDVDWIVEFAEDGETALQVLELTSPDVVITDLVMPNMDGIELVRAAKKSYPNVPVIIISGQGSEEKAVEALRAGAASYVAKARLAERLLDTVEQILSLNDSERNNDRLMACATGARYQFKLENDPSMIAPLIDFVRSLMKQLRLGDVSDQRHVGVALEEAILNAMFHGNLELPPTEARNARRILHEGKLSSMVEQRRSEPPYNTRGVLVGADLNHHRAQFIIRDGGSGFDVAALPSAKDPQTIEGKNGRGMTLIRNFMDDVSFNDTGNEIRMTLSR